MVTLVQVPEPVIAQRKLIQCVTRPVNVLPLHSEKVLQNVHQVRAVHQSLLPVLLSTEMCSWSFLVFNRFKLLSILTHYIKITDIKGHQFFKRS